MASLAVTNTLSSGATILASEHNTNYSDIVTYVNNRNSGSSSWDALYSLSTSTVPLRCDNSTGTQNIANFYDNGTEVLVIKDGGNVGVGETSPFTQLANSPTNYLCGNTGSGTESILWRSTVVGYVASFINDNTSAASAGGVIIETENTTDDTDPEDNAILSCLANDTMRFMVTPSGKVAIGTVDPHTSSILHLVSTTKGFIPPRMTTAQRDAIGTPSSGLIIYNDSTNKINVYTGSAWEAVTSA